MGNEPSIGIAVKTLSNQLRRLMGRDIALQYGDNVGGMQLWAAGFVYRKSQTDDVFQKDIEKEFHIRRSTATRMLQSMEKNGLIRRVPVESDARVKKIVFTEKTAKINESIEERIEMTEQQLRKGISQKELDLFFATIGKMNRNLEEMLKG